MSKKGNAGFTLVEAVIALAVSSVLIFIIINFMTNSIVQYAVADARAELLNDAQSALDTIGDDIRLSGNADETNRWPDAFAPGAPDDEFSWQGGAGTLILATAAEDSNKNIIFADAKEYISLKNNNIYYLEGTNLYKRTLAAENPYNAARTTCPSFAQSATCPADRLLMGSVEQLTFKYKDASDQEVIPSEARSVEMNIQLKSSRYGREVSVGYSTRMVFRND